MSLWLNGQLIPMDRFPNGERHWKVDLDFWKGAWVRDELSDFDDNVLSWQWQSDSDLVDLMMLGDWLKRLGLSVNRVEVAYLPYSRLDRAPMTEVFSLSSVAAIFRNFPSLVVELLDPHSDVSCALIPNTLATYPIQEFWPNLVKAITFRDTQDWETVVVFPDSGAEKRYASLFTERILVGVKHRDPADGKISYRGFLGEFPEGPWQAVIVDDLCSYGNTFMQSAKALRAAGAQSVYLYVTHAEAAMLQGELFSSKLINRVFTTDTMGMTRQEHNDALYVWPLWEERLAKLANRCQAEDECSHLPASVEEYFYEDLCECGNTFCMENHHESTASLQEGEELR